MITYELLACPLGSDGSLPEPREPAEPSSSLVAPSPWRLGLLSHSAHVTCITCCQGLDCHKGLVPFEVRVTGLARLAQSGWVTKGLSDYAVICRRRRGDGG